MNNIDSNKDRLQQFIHEQGYDPNFWFVEFVGETSQQMRVEEIADKKQYLSGDHAITRRLPEAFAGKLIEPRKVVLNYARRLIEYATSYLIGDGFTYSGDQQLVKEINKLNKIVFNSIDYDVVKDVYSYGNSFEHIYRNGNKIKSRLIDSTDSFPVIDSEGEYIAFVESYTSNGVSYWNVFVDEEVYKYNNNGGDVRHLGTYKNLGGLPINYRNSNPLNSFFGRSDLDDYISILDSQEDLLSKAIDGFYRFITGIPVIKGQILTNYEMPKNVAGAGLVLDSDADFYFANNEFDHQAFETLYSHLMTALLDVSGTPSVALGKTDVSNLSEVSLRLLYGQAVEKGKITERYIKEGLYQRLDKLRVLLEAQGKVFNEDAWDSINITFQFNTPSSDTETINNLKTLRDMDAISIESIMKHSRYINDISSEQLIKQREKSNGDSVNTA